MAAGGSHIYVQSGADHIVGHALYFLQTSKSRTNVVSMVSLLLILYTAFYNNAGSAANVSTMWPCL